MRNVKKRMASVKMYDKGSMRENRFLDKEHEWKGEKNNARREERM